MLIMRGMSAADPWGTAGPPASVGVVSLVPAAAVYAPPPPAVDFPVGLTVTSSAPAAMPAAAVYAPPASAPVASNSFVPTVLPWQAPATTTRAIRKQLATTPTTAPSSNTWKWLLGLAAAGGGYYWWKNR